ncbi:uncharacterized protein B4U80_01610 [Leptotrombidium deliense]|uniref:Uncharacterized protein n=1 Tax=Leptotrombidium deliense TaxID=299467 RepID=A0A443SRG6_9ACAR|nr:uncharacterized protein B4U80_01610 [Leptotrombidium deliense]
MITSRLSSLVVAADEYSFVKKNADEYTELIRSENVRDEKAPFALLKRKCRKSSRKRYEMQVNYSEFYDLCRKREEYKLRNYVKHNKSVVDVNVNFKDANGMTGFSYLCHIGDLTLLRIASNLKEIDVNIEDNEGNTPLILASQAGHSSVVAFLIDHFKNALDIDKRNYFGVTALIKASLLGRVKCVKTLLAAGANPILRDPNKGYTALEWAKYCGRAECAHAINFAMKHCEDPFYRNFKKYAKSIEEAQQWLKEALTRNQTMPTTRSKPPFNTVLSAITSSTALCAAFTVLPAISKNDEKRIKESQNEKCIPQIEVTKLEFTDCEQQSS